MLSNFSGRFLFIDNNPVPVEYGQKFKKHPKKNIRSLQVYNYTNLLKGAEPQSRGI